MSTIKFPIASNNTNLTLINIALNTIQSNQVDFFAYADQIWILLCGFLVFFMHAGFTMLEAGSVRHRNAVNIMFKNVGTLSIAGIFYYLWGYAFAYGEDNSENASSKFIGSGNYALSQETNDTRHEWFFQWAFAATAATILSGAVGGRVSLLGYFIAAAWITSFVYPVISHWIWSSYGWASAFTAEPLSETALFGACGVIDYAGSGVVHMTGGVCALWGALILGPRIGRFAEDGTSIKIPAHNLSMVTLGTLILWFGWYGFNCGSTLAFDGGNAAKVATTTTLSASTSAFTAIVLSRTFFGHFDLPFALNSILGGLVGITAGCSTVEDWAAVIIGFISCLVYKGASWAVDRVRIDDPVDAIAVHGVCGIWGLLAVGIFATPDNIAAAYSGRECAGWTNGIQFASQLVAVLAIFGWVTLLMVPTFLILKVAKIWRVNPEWEQQGLDKSEHGGQAAFIGNDDEEFAKNSAKQHSEGNEQPNPTNSEATQEGDAEAQPEVPTAEVVKQ